tara:strand:- start:561 stop:1403 length:843 start_codon:yes stop_codon:yes gene_type:complete
MRILLNTILLDPNRWTADKIPYHPLEKLLPEIKKYGFNELELWQYHISRHSHSQILRLVDYIASLEMTCPVLGAYPALHLLGNKTEESQRLELLIKFACRLDVKVFKIFAGNIASENMNADQTQQAIKSLQSIASQLDNHGILLALETHANTLCDTPNNTIKVLESLGRSKNVGCCFQPYMENDTETAIEFFDKISPHAIHIHLQNRKTKKKDCCLLSEGDWINYNLLLPHLYKSKYKGDLSIEFTADMATPDNPDSPIQSVLENAILDRNFILSHWHRG